MPQLRPASSARFKVSRLLCAAAVVGLGVVPVRAKAATDGQIQASIQRAVAFLQQEVNGRRAGHDSLAAYALLKAERPATDPVVAAVLKQIQAKVDDENYRPRSHHVYEAGVDLMVLEAANPIQYAREIEAVTAYLIEQQRPSGAWDYPNRVSGDTSISQYALLGLWAAGRAGIEVPVEVWSRAAAWHLRYQYRNGAFGYQPADAPRMVPLHSMTVAGVGSLNVIRQFLPEGRREVRRSARKESRPAGDKSAQRSPGTPSPSPRPRENERTTRFTVFGVLERIDLGGDTAPAIPTDETDESAEQQRESNILPQRALDSAIGQGMGWLAANYTIDRPTTDKNAWAAFYYLYALERTAALAKTSKIGNHDWYAEGSDFLLRTQDQDGGWTGRNSSMSRMAATSFGILFLTKSTSKIVAPIPKRKPRVYVGSGLLSGGRGLPDNLSAVKTEDGKIVQQTVQAPLDELLAELSTPKDLTIEAAQTAIVQSVQIGNREELIGQKERLLKLADDPRPEVRRTALWALGRCDDLRLASTLIAALRDPDLAVVVEARNALCTLSRRPLGFGLPHDPAGNAPQEAAEAERRAAIEYWRAEAIKRWTDWYLRVRPYDERDDLLELRHRS